MTTLAEHIIVAGAKNRPPMLEKSMYVSWACRIRLFIKGKKHGRMMLDSIDNGPLVYPTVEENRQTRPMKYSKLTEARQLQDDFDVQATNIILHDLPPDVYALVNHQEISGSSCVKDINAVLNALPSKWSKFVIDVKLAKSLYTTNYDQLYAYLSQHERHANEVHITRERYPDPLALQGEDLIECINKAMAFLSAIASRFPPSNNQLRTSSNPINQVTIQDGRVTVQQVQGRQNQSYAGTGNKRITTTSKGNYAAGQPRVMKCYNCQGEGHMVRQYTQPKRLRNAAWFKEKLILAEAREAGQILDEEQLAFLADLGISEAPVSQQIIPHNSAFQTKDLDAYNSDCDDLSLAKAVLMENLSSCDPKVLSEESQNAVIQDTNSSAPNDLLVLSLVEQMTDHVAHLDKENHTNKIVNESLTAELERYKERIAIFEQRLNVDLNKPQRIQPTLYDGSVIAKEHVVISVIDDEETLILEEHSRSKMLDKQNDPISIEKKIKISPIDYSKLNKIKEDFVTSPTPVRIEAPSELPKCLELETELLTKKDLIEKDVYDKLLKSYSTLEKHCISLELTTQLNQEVFQKDNFHENQNAPTFNQLFELNELKAPSQEMDSVIRKLKDRIKSLSGKDKLVQSKEHYDSLIAQINAKSVENSKLNAQLQEKIFAITDLKNELKKLKGKNVVDTTVSKPNATIAPGMFKLDIEPISHRL
ncbi:hypothetical protein Tco_0469757 [Tanacetum coccineum]